MIGFTRGVLSLVSRSRARIVPDPRTIALVGNGNIDPSWSEEIDGADLVVRFNCAPHCGGSAGKKIDVLVLVNWSYPGRRFKWKPFSINRLARSGAAKFIFTTKPKDIPTLMEREGNVPGDATKYILATIVRGREYSFFPLSNRFETERKLQRYGAKVGVIPSTGAQAVNFFATEYPGAIMRLYGFTHQGWGGHDWAAEKAWISSVLADRA